MATQSAIDNDRERLQKLVQGWLNANAIINDTRDRRPYREAIEIMEHSFFELDEHNAEAELAKVRLTTLGDNKNFFGMNRRYTGERGENLYNYFWKAYREARLAQGARQPWSSVVDLSFIRRAKLRGRQHDPEPPPRYNCEGAHEVLSDRRLDVNFVSGQSTLSKLEADKIDRDFAHLARIFLHDCILIEGNTDDVGSDEMNRRLSLRRAESVRRHLVRDYGFSPARFQVRGNGEKKFHKLEKTFPGSLEELRRVSRRTDFELLRATSKH